MPVPDARLDALVALVKPKTIVADDGRIRRHRRPGARARRRAKASATSSSRNIRETDAIAHVVRCFEDDNVIHVEGRVDPVADVDTIDTELCLKDLETVDKRIERAKKALKGAGAAKDEKQIARAAASGCTRASTRASRCARRALDAEEQALVARPAACSR